ARPLNYIELELGDEEALPLRPDLHLGVVLTLVAAMGDGVPVVRLLGGLQGEHPGLPLVEDRGAILALEEAAEVDDVLRGQHAPEQAARQRVGLAPGGAQRLHVGDPVAGDGALHVRSVPVQREVAPGLSPAPAARSIARAGVADGPAARPRASQPSENGPLVPAARPVREGRVCYTLGSDVRPAPGG